jgi:hypothetical protein
MAEQKRNSDLRRENDKLEKKAKEWKNELALYNAIQRCRKLRDCVSDSYPWAREYDAFICRDMVCGHHPLEPPHYHKPPPHCSFFTAFLLQSVLLANFDNSMAHLAWFAQVLAPRPPDAVAIEAALQEALAAHKGKGKVASTDPTAPRDTPSHTNSLSHASHGRNEPRLRHTGSSKKMDPSAPGPSTGRRPAVSKRSQRISSDSESHHSRGSPSDSSSSPPSDDEPPAREMIDHGEGTIQYIAKHAYRKELRSRGRKSGLGFLIKWVDHPLDPSEPWWDVHAVLRLDPSYLKSYAIYGPHESSDSRFAKVIKRSQKPLRVAAINRFFRTLYDEHRYAVGFPVLERTRSMELLSNDEAPIPPLPAAPHAIVTAIPFPEDGYESPGVLNDDGERTLTRRNYAPPTPLQATPAPAMMPQLPVPQAPVLQAPVLHAPVLQDPADSPDTEALFDLGLLGPNVSPAQPHGPTPAPPAPVPLPTASPQHSGRIRLSALSPSVSQQLAARPRPALPPPPHNVPPPPQRPPRGGAEVHYQEPKHGTRPLSNERHPRKQGRNSHSQDKRDSKRGKRDDHDQVLHLRDTSTSRSPSPRRPSKGSNKRSPKEERSPKQDHSRSRRKDDKDREHDDHDPRVSRGDGRDRDAAHRS